MGPMRRGPTVLITIVDNDEQNIANFATTVGPRLIGPIGTEDFSPLSQVHL